jgi:hypothetical protein
MVHFEATSKFSNNMYFPLSSVSNTTPIQVSPHYQASLTSIHAQFLPILHLFFTPRVSTHGLDE